MGGRWSPQRLALQSKILAGKRRRKLMKPPYPCPICCNEEVVEVVKKEDFVHPNPEKSRRMMTFACRLGCFEHTVVLKSLNLTVIDGYNKVVDELGEEET